MKQPGEKRKRPRQPSPLMRRIDKACAQMNGALTAVAIALAILLTLTAAVRGPSLLAGASSEQNSD
jgi:hypothetical protein